MSSQKGNSSRSRAQKHKNSVAFKNDKYGATIQVKKANSKLHDGLCSRCKEVLEWKVKYGKYKSLTQPRKCVKCFEKAVKDAYHVICKPCALKLDLCSKCGKNEEIVIPVRTAEDVEEEEEDTNQKKKGRKKKDVDEFDSDDDDDDDDDFGSDDDDEFFSVGSEPKEQAAAGAKASLPDVSRVHFQD